MKVGDEVVCIKAHHAVRCPLKKGRKYTIYNSKACHCGNVLFNVGIPSTAPFGNCNKCLSRWKSDGVWWLNSTRFAPIEYNFLSAELLNKEVVEEKLDTPVKEPKKEKV